jgi:hypothetical protein
MTYPILFERFIYSLMMGIVSLGILIQGEGVVFLSANFGWAKTHIK